MKIALGTYNKQSEVTGHQLKLACIPTSCITELYFRVFHASKSLHKAGLQRETLTMGKVQKK